MDSLTKSIKPDRSKIKCIRLGSWTTGRENLASANQSCKG